MNEIKKILVVCIGNSDRSPLMGAILGMFLRNSGYDVTVESAGIGPSANSGAPAPFGVTAAKRMGLDLSKHVRRRTTTLDLSNYDLILPASPEIAGTLIEQGTDFGKVDGGCTVPNPWPVKFQEDFDNKTVPAILEAMYRVMCRYGNQFCRRTC